jgi:hypothetical protein
MAVTRRPNKATIEDALARAIEGAVSAAMSSSRTVALTRVAWDLRVALRPAPSEQATMRRRLWDVLWSSAGPSDAAAVAVSLSRGELGC